MKGNLPKIIFLVVMVFVAFKTLSQGVKSLKREPAPPETTAPLEEEVLSEAPSSPGPAAAASVGAGTADSKREDALSVLSDYRRVPFSPPEETRAAASKAVETSTQLKSQTLPQLTTVLHYEGKWFAVINGNLLKEGDTVGRMKVVDIRENSVDLEEAGEIFHMKLWEEDLSQ